MRCQRNESLEGTDTDDRAVVGEEPGLHSPRQRHDCTWPGGDPSEHLYQIPSHGVITGVCRFGEEPSAKRREEIGTVALELLECVGGAHRDD